MKCETCEKYDDCRNGSGLVWPCWAYVPAVAAADVVEVVRCRECKHRHTGGCPMIGYCNEIDGHAMPLDDDFCSYGERKENRDEPL